MSRVLRATYVNVFLVCYVRIHTYCQFILHKYQHSQTSETRTGKLKTVAFERVEGRRNKISLEHLQSDNNSKTKINEYRSLFLDTIKLLQTRLDIKAAAEGEPKHLISRLSFMLCIFRALAMCCLHRNAQRKPSVVFSVIFISFCGLLSMTLNAEKISSYTCQPFSFQYFLTIFVERNFVHLFFFNTQVKWHCMKFLSDSLRIGAIIARTKAVERKTNCSKILIMENDWIKWFWSRIKNTKDQQFSWSCIFEKYSRISVRWNDNKQPITNELLFSLWDLKMNLQICVVVIILMCVLVRRVSLYSKFTRSTIFISTVFLPLSVRTSAKH